MTKKFDDFKRELIELCERHQVALSTNMSSQIVVQNLEPGLPAAWWAQFIDDETDAP